MAEATVDRPPDTGGPKPDEKEKKGLFGFPDPSGKNWRRDEGDDKPPKPPRPSTPRSESKAARKKKAERRLGTLVTGVAGLAAMVGAEYPGQVILHNSTDFVDAVMEIAEDDPRILDWFDSKLMVSGYWKLAMVGVSMSLPIAAYYGAAPEFVIPLLGAPPIPDEPLDDALCQKCGHPLHDHYEEGCSVPDCECEVTDS